MTSEYHPFHGGDWVIKECDPCDHLTSVHWHGNFPFRAEPWANFAVFQSRKEYGGYNFMSNNCRAQENTAKRPMPRINEEYGYEDHHRSYPWDQARLWPSRTADNRRSARTKVSISTFPPLPTLPASQYQ